MHCDQRTSSRSGKESRVDFYLSMYFILLQNWRSQTGSKIKPPSQLERSRSARTEDVSGPARRLAEVWIEQIVAVATLIGNVEHVKALDKDLKLVTFAVAEELREPNVLRIEVLAEAIVLRDA